VIKKKSNEDNFEKLEKKRSNSSIIEKKK